MLGSVLFYVVIAVLIFGVLIATHELGHFATAKLLGVQVNEFAVGMGPALWKKEKGETLYSIRALPIGGYCAMEGEDEESDNPRAFGRASGWKKIVILCAGAFMNFLTGFVLILILFSQATGFVLPTIDGFLEGYGVEDSGLQPGDVVYSLDGHRISIRKMELKNEVSDKKLIVPGKTLIEISKILSGEVESLVNISYTNNHIVFEFDNTIVVSRLIEGEYFKIDQMLSSDYETKLKINKKELLNCIDRATLLIKEGDKKPIIINIQDGVMELKIKSQVGSMNEEIEIEKEGKDLLIGFNPKFLIDALRVIDDEEVTLYLMNAKAPCFIRDDEESYIYLILPVNFNAVS